MTKKLVIFGILILIAVVLAGLVFWALFRKEPEIPSAPPEPAPSLSKIELGNCQSLHPIDDRLICLSGSRDGLSLTQYDPIAEKLTTIRQLSPETSYENLYWAPGNQKLLLQDFDQSFWVVENDKPLELKDVVSANWYEADKILAVKKNDDTYQLVILSIQTRQIHQELIDSLSIATEYVEASPDLKTILMIAPTDIADERVVMILGEGRLQRLQTSLAINQISWIDDSRLIALTNRGIASFDVVNNKQKLLIKSPKISQLVFYHQPVYKTVGIYDSSIQQIQEFDLGSFELKNQISLEGFSRISQIYKSATGQLFVVDQEMLYKADLP